MHAYRSHTCAALRAEHVGQEVRLSGWVHRVRDHGGVLFVDLRDHHGITQVIADPDSPAFKGIEDVRAEWVIRIDGTVKARAEDLKNPKLDTGDIEVYARDMEVLGAVEGELPLPVFGDVEYPEETRLRYRFLDLRREKLHNNIILRSKVISHLRSSMTDQSFLEYQTPILTASSPEGARDFLVPSRLHPGKVYALPQAPQQFKQLIMVAGFDRYFQIAPCFRDEDPRADRSPGEFYQLDIEMSFVTQEDVFQAIEPVMRGVFETFGGGRPVTGTFPRIPYAESLLKYGSDKPDLRNPIEMQVVSEHFAGSGFKIFAQMLETEGNEVRAIPAPTGGSRKFCDRMNSWAQKEGLPGMGYIFWREEGGETVAAGPLAKNIGPERSEAIRVQLGLGLGDAAFFLAGKPSSFLDVAGRARNVIGKELKLLDEDRFELAWIVDFPMFEYDEEAGRLDFSHNPFSMPQGGMEALEGDDPLSVLGYQYDIVCNGVELSSGAIRNHKPEIMYKAFEITGQSREFVDENFGGMISAFKFGAPPHGGIAPGVDRIVMLLAGAENLRDVIMFPMNQKAEDLMMGAPAAPTNEQLRELGLRVIPRD
ncbi:aspartyl-tRNA synthetase [Albimonas donghaensis]|uniref:Aspartate--tRNA(Asp/Asn) ligase n=1 Tax=Albimonas donghaensis TaxID=356660 RepID=A0A1H3ARU5_9RHOB|nr:aspartate--tRNA ligase [Albimonas donghaensis]SDX31854.1 aspartyl-tRNA synthetase [Albimonas donghaensis]